MRRNLIQNLIGLGFQMWPSFLLIAPSDKVAQKYIGVYAIWTSESWFLSKFVGD